MSTSKRHWILVTLAALVAAMAAAVPTAGADPWWNGEQVSTVRPDDRSGLRGPGTVESAGAAEQIALRPDDRPGPQGPGAVPDKTPVIVTSLADTFDWRDAGIGAAFAFGLLAVGGGVLLVIRYRKTSVATV